MPDSSRSLFLSDFARKRELWWQFTVRAVELRHRGSHLGLFWSVLNPLLSLALYGSVFGFIYSGHLRGAPNESHVDFALGVFLGLILFHVVAETLGVAPTVIVSNPNLVKKVVFPLEVLPLAQLGASWLHFLISLALLFLGLITLGGGLSLAGLLWLPVLLLPLLFLTAGLCWLLAALGVFFRDINQIVSFVSQIILWSSAVFYPVSRLRGSHAAWSILKWNPFLQIIQLMRDALLWHEPINLRSLAYAYAAGLAVFALGGWFFKKMKSAFADVI